MRKPVPRKSGKHNGRGDPEGRGLLFELLAGLDTGVAVVSSTGVLLYANHRFAELMCFRSRLRLRGLNLKDHISARSWPDFDAAMRQATARTVEGDVTLDVAGEIHTVRLVFSSIAGDARKIRITASEVTELVETSRALHSSQASVQSLSARILQVEDEERRRIARDLHDTTGQEVAALAMALHQADVHSREATPQARQAIGDSIALAAKIESEIRTLSYLLHPPLLDELGLRAAIDWFVVGFSERSGIQLSVEIPQTLPRFSSRQETVLFRVVQGALANVLRHSASHTARIRISFGTHRVQLCVEDDGKGMNAAQLAAARQGLATGVGIGGMRERLLELGGALEINSSPRGTQVIATLPLGKIEPLEKIEPLWKVEKIDEPAPIEAPSAEAASFAALPPQLTASIVRKRILIADDHEVTRQGIRTLLAAQADLEVVGEAADGLEAVAKTESLKPDLVLMDLTMPRLGGLAAANKIRKFGAEPKILIFTTHSFPGLVHTLRSAGCQGYVLKEHASTDLANGIQQVLHGNAFYCKQTS